MVERIVQCVTTNVLTYRILKEILWVPKSSPALLMEEWVIAHNQVATGSDWSPLLFFSDISGCAGILTVC